MPRPDAIAFDAVESAVAKGHDVVLVDTAGRLHNKKHLMDELSKLKRVMQKVAPGVPHAVLLVLDGSGPPDPIPPSGRVRVVEATCNGSWELPAVGEVGAPAAVLVRPDGHVAWAGDPHDPGLVEAARRWFGTRG